MKDVELAKDIEVIRAFAQKEPERLNAQLGLKLHDCSRSERWASYRFKRKECWRNPYGGVHGGIICSMIDASMGMTCAAFTNSYVSTADLSVSYLKPMMNEDYIVKVELTQIGNRMIRCMAKVTDAESGQLCATGMSSFIIIGSRVESREENREENRD